MRNKIMITAVLALMPAALTAQSGEATGNARIAATLEAAAGAGIPESLLESKVQEGRAKGVSEARIAGALESRLEALVRARDAMRDAELETVTAGELSVAADALQAGVSEEALVSVTRSAPRERRLVATAVLGALVEMGVASEQARVRVHDALGQGSQALANLHAEVAAQLRLRGNGGGGGVLPSLEGRGAASGNGLIRLGPGGG